MSPTQDRQEIRELIENWALWRDTGDWARLRSVWHADGRMIATWFAGTADEFIEVCRAGQAKGFRGWHVLGGTTVDVVGERAIAQTRVTISQRLPIDGIECDVVCTGRFYDFVERRDGRWGLVVRQPIYEKDRIDPVSPSAHIVLDPAVLTRFPAGYRHLAYLQTQAGYRVNPRLPGLDGPETDMLYLAGQGWLRGEPLAWPKPAEQGA